MTKFERLLTPGSRELPDCQCGAEMRFSRSSRTEKAPDIEVRVYECPSCAHEFRLSVWADAAHLVAARPAGAVEGL